MIAIIVINIVPSLFKNLDVQLPRKTGFVFGSVYKVQIVINFKKRVIDKTVIEEKLQTLLMFDYFI